MIRPIHTQGAEFSACRRYRYSLWRHWGEPSEGYAMFIGLNPSTADETINDPTVRRCIGFAQDWGYGGLVMTNLFGFRATKPGDMKAVTEPIGPENDTYLAQLARDAAIVVAAWGNHGSHLGRADAVMRLLPSLQHLALTQQGQPGHPLYLASSLRPTPLHR